MTQDLGRLNLPQPVDYAEIRVDVASDTPGVSTPYTVVASTGSVCRNGNDRCYDAYAVRSMGFPQSSGNVGSYVVYTRNSEVGVIDTIDDLLAFLGPIDTPAEAMLSVTLTAAGPSNDGFYDCASDDAWAVFPIS